MNDSASTTQDHDPSVMPIRRDLHFTLPQARIGNWHDAGVHVTQFFNAMSLFFPDGERFFIHAVRHYRERIQDPELQKAVTGFIGQEAMHGREHTECNEMLDHAGLPGSSQQQFVYRLLERVKRRAPKPMQLSATIALEHLTAIMASALLSDERVVGQAEPHFARMWRWHALEETEHKAVAYDVWLAVMPKTLLSYMMRVWGLIIATAIFWPLVMLFHWRILRADPAARPNLFSGYLKMWRWQFFSPGPLRRAAREWFDYFKPGFHPWDHNNRQHLQQLEPLVREIETAQAA